MPLLPEPDRKRIGKPKRVVITGGGTIAPIDAVRHITNGSSGLLAACLTEAALQRDDEAHVWHIHAPHALRPFHRDAVLRLDDLNTDADIRAERERLDDLRQRYQRQRSRLNLVPLSQGAVADYERTLLSVLTDQHIDLAILAMAVSDFEPEQKSGKLSSRSERLVIECQRTPKVIQRVKIRSPDTFLVGFKLVVGLPETQLIDIARHACVENRADVTVGNDWEELRRGQHRLIVVDADGATPPEVIGPATAPLLARSLIDALWSRAFPQ